MQSFTVVALLVCSLAFSQAKPDIGFGSIRNLKNSPRVINGEDAVLGQFPYQASMQLRGLLGQGHFCGGSILSENVILTAGHCVTEVGQPPLTHFEVRVGLANLNNEGDSVQTSRLLDTIVHPEYEGGVNPNDLAIHILETPLTLNDNVQTIGLPEPDSIPEGEAVLSGWGSTSTSNNPVYPQQLQYSNVEIISHDECEDIWGVGDSPLAETNVCTGVPVGDEAGACSGDSGGPLVQNGTIVGIVSWGQIPCGNFPSVFTRVSAFNEFIEEQLDRAKTLLRK